MQLRDILGRIFLLGGLLAVGIMYLSGLFEELEPRISRSRPPAGIEDYWQDTQLTEESFLPFLDDNICHASKKAFLACANGITHIAQFLGRSLNHPLLLQNSPEGTTQLTSKDLPQSEKEGLSHWLKMTTEERQRVSFLKYWNELKSHIQPSRLAEAMSRGVNGVYSILLDPHSYITPLAFYKNVVAKVENHFQQTGFQLRPYFTPHGKLVGYRVKKVVSGSPADRAFIKKGDIFISIDGHDLKTLGPMAISELLKKPPETRIDITLSRNNLIHRTQFQRTPFALPSVTSQYIEAIKPFGSITINKFAVGSCLRVKTEVLSLMKNDLRGLVLDLRDNPGGQIEEASCIAGLFVGPKKIFQLHFLKSEQGQNEEFFGGENEAIYNGPMAVLINSGTASASEILAGALQDYKRALLVGRNTFGKGSFQEGQLWPKNNKIIFFKTKGVYSLPSGRSPQLVGLSPDLFIPDKDEDSAPESEQKNYLNPLPPLLLSKMSEFLFLQQKAVPSTCLKTEDLSIDLKDKELSFAQSALFCTSASL